MKVSPKKSLGQNFLMDNEILNLIVNLGEINPNDIILEVGPGTGNLTEKILKKKPKRIIAIEKDKNLSEFLKKNLIMMLKLLTTIYLIITFSPFIKKK